MTTFFSIILNNSVVRVDAKSTILQASEDAGVLIPRFCYYPHLSVAGNCRICVVELQKSPKPVVSCAMPVTRGMIVFTESPLIKKARESVLEFLLLNHPLDCPICDQGGECDLQNETFYYGRDSGRNFFLKRTVENKECGPIIKTIMTRCIHCTRCIRFSTEIMGQEFLGSSGRGEQTEIGFYINSFLKTELAGNLIDLCPVGALTSKPYAFAGRPWELIRRDTVDFSDGICIDISIDLRSLSKVKVINKKDVIITEENIVRITPNYNSFIKEFWISDKTRFAFDGLQNNRVLFAIKNRLSISQISEKLEIFLSKNLMKQREIPVGIVVGALFDLEGFYVINQFLKLWGGTDFQYGNYKIEKNLDIPFYYSLNSELSAFEKTLGICFISTNPRREASILNTFLFNQQTRREMYFCSISTYSFLRLKYDHYGNGIRAFLTLLENRGTESSFMYLKSNFNFMFSFENFKSKQAFFYENLLKFLSKKFFLKTKTKEGLGFLHSSVGSLNFCHLAYNGGVRSSFFMKKPNDKKCSVLFLANVNDFSKKTWFSGSFDIESNTYSPTVWINTHHTASINPTMTFPLKSFYEKKGYIFNIENRLRQFNKVQTSNQNVWSVESFFFNLLKKHPDWQYALTSFWNFPIEVPIISLFEQIIPSFFFNLYTLKINQKIGCSSLFFPTSENFYFTDDISLNSLTMAECYFFLEKKNNFLLEASS